VERVLGRRIKHGKSEFFVNWKGFGPEENTWEPEEHLYGCKELVREYVRSLKSTDLSPRTTVSNNSIYLLLLVISTYGHFILI
jgi:hypothetical protein